MEKRRRYTRGSCCWAIYIVKDPNSKQMFGPNDEDCSALKRVFAPGSREAFWMGDDDEVRILALCFMAAMVETGDA
jgi:hypothetical protein